MSKVADNKIQANFLADNKIQAKTPEVGDVWLDEDTNEKLLIVRINEHIVGFECLLYNTDNNISYTEVYYFLTNCKYLGKSKVKIEDLFKTENE